MSAHELVTVKIDERSVQVPKGTGLVETAAAAGIEIPVFCYEPRLGEAIGACRMCLVEVEGGPPKPQAACTLTVQPDMVVKTALTSKLAREAQDATLEFILVNHPLDRERCILCYRCTRFSESVAEDGQLVAVNRGAQSMIATFEDEPYRSPFSGNVIELCPVGALTSTQYRFEARPWEIQNVPTVC